MDQLQHKLVEAFSKPLPGRVAQEMMAPSSRNPLHINHQLAPIPSAVLLLLYPKDGKWLLPLVKRQTYKGNHSGQISLPGGKKEDGDITLLQTALRETDEEIGVKVNENQAIDKLSNLHIPISNFMVHPYVAIIDYLPEFIPDTHEVKHLIELPLACILDKKYVREKELISQKHHISAPVYQLDNDYIWGATAMILSEFAEILKRINFK